MAIKFETNPLVWKQTDGIYIAEQDVPGPVQIVGTNVVKIVGEFPWGQADTILEVGSPEALRDKLLGGYSKPREFGGYRAVKGKTFGPLQIIRVEADDAAKGSVTIRDNAVVTIGTVDDSATYTVTIDSTGYNYTATTGDTAADIAAGLVGVINADDSAVVGAIDNQDGTLDVYGNGSETWTIAVSVGGTGTITKTDPANAYTVTAKYTGAPANEMEIVHTQTAGGDFILEVYWGGVAEELEPQPFTAQGMTDASEDSEFVDLELHVDGGSNPSTRENGVNLAGGDDGTLTEDNWTGTSTSMEGLRVLEQAEPRGYVVAADHTSSAWITALREHLDLMGAEGGAQADPSDDLDTNATAAEAIADERLELMLHRVKQSVDNKTYVVDLAPFYASVWSQIPPHYSVADYDNREYLEAVAGLPDGVTLSWAQWRKAQTVGGVTLERLNVGGWKFHASITSDPSKPSEIRRRLTDVVGDTIGQALLPFQNKPALSLYADNAVASVEGALTAMQGEDGIPQTQMIEGFDPVEVISKSADTIILGINVKYWGEFRYIVANLTAGAGVTLEQAA